MKIIVRIGLVSAVIVTAALFGVQMLISDSWPTECGLSRSYVQRLDQKSTHSGFQTVSGNERIYVFSAYFDSR